VVTILLGHPWAKTTHKWSPDGEWIVSASSRSLAELDRLGLRRSRQSRAPSTGFPSGAFTPSCAGSPPSIAALSLALTISWKARVAVRRQAGEKGPLVWLRNGLGPRQPRALDSCLVACGNFGCPTATATIGHAARAGAFIIFEVPACVKENLHSFSSQRRDG